MKHKPVTSPLGNLWWNDCAKGRARIVKATIEQSEATAAAKLAWAKMDDNQKACVRFGMMPLEIMQEFLGSVHSDDRDRLLTLAIMQCAKNNGGMVA